MSDIKLVPKICKFLKTYKKHLLKESQCQRESYKWITVTIYHFVNSPICTFRN